MTPSYSFTRRARLQIRRIFDYSLVNFGEVQAERYYQDLLGACRLLASHPRIGRPIDYVRTGYFRFEHSRHILIYTLAQHSVKIVAVFHERMDLKRHL